MNLHTSPISGVDCFKDKYIATAGYDNKVILWDSQNKKAIASGEHNHLANACKFSECGNFLVSASSDYSAMLWKIPSMEKIATLLGHTDDIEMAAINNSNTCIATASRDHSINLYDMDGNYLSKLSGHNADVISISWLNDQSLISSSDDGTVRVWNLSNGSHSIYNFESIETDTIALVNENLFFAGNDNGDIITINNNITYTKAHQSGIKRLYYNKDGNILISTSYDRKLKVWKLNEENILELYRESEFPSIIWPRSISMSSENEIVFSTFGSSYATFTIETNEWNTSNIEKTFGINCVIESNNQLFHIGDAGDFYQDSHCIKSMHSLCNFIVKSEFFILTGGQLGEIYNAVTGEIIYKHHSPLNCATFIKGNEYNVIAVGTYTGEAILLKEKDNLILFSEILKIHSNAIKGICNNGNYLFSASANKEIALTDCIQFKTIQKVSNAHDRIINACIHLKDNLFITIGRDLKYKIWDGIDLYLSHLTQQKHSLKCIAKSSNNETIAIGSYSGEIQIYNINNNELIRKYNPTKQGISSLTFRDSSKTFIASSYDGNLYEIRL